MLSNNAIKIPSQFQVIDRLPKEEGSVEFAHDVFRVKKVCLKSEAKDKAKYQRYWFLKKAPSYFHACIEMLSQELSRLVYSLQPKTRIIYNSNDKSYYVISKEIPGFTSFSTLAKNLKSQFAQQLQSGHYRGFGITLILLLWLNENDGKPGNFCVDSDGNVLKIDGEQSYAQVPGRVFSNNTFLITPHLLAHLPFNFQYHYQSYHWLDQFFCNQLNRRYQSQHYKKEQTLFSEEMIYQSNRSPWFTKEVNQTILRIILLPDDLIAQLVKTYLAVNPINPRCPERDTINDIILLLWENKNKLLKSALRLPLFHDYILNQSKNDVNDLIGELNTFNLFGKVNLTHIDENIAARINDHYEKLLVIINNNSSPLYTRTESLDVISTVRNLTNNHQSAFFDDSLYGEMQVMSAEPEKIDAQEKHPIKEELDDDSFYEPTQVYVNPQNQQEKMQDDDSITIEKNEGTPSMMKASSARIPTSHSTLFAFNTAAENTKETYSPGQGMEF